VLREIDFQVKKVSDTFYCDTLLETNSFVDIFTYFCTLVNSFFSHQLNNPLNLEISLGSSRFSYDLIAGCFTFNSEAHVQ